MASTTTMLAKSRSLPNMSFLTNVDAGNMGRNVPAATDQYTQDASDAHQANPEYEQEPHSNQQENTEEVPQTSGSVDVDQATPAAQSTVPNVPEVSVGVSSSASQSQAHGSRRFRFSRINIDAINDNKGKKPPKGAAKPAMRQTLMSRGIDVPDVNADSREAQVLKFLRMSREHPAEYKAFLESVQGMVEGRDMKIMINKYEDDLEKAMAEGAASPPSGQNGRVKESQEGPGKGEPPASAAATQHEKSAPYPQQPRHPSLSPSRPLALSPSLPASPAQ
ncbi:unnamed protein product [Vitrella brassicaformis CCMP3155]|uniref:Uncharacterized protein n=1 Tax=Vitrella brassicaformis (strain CCMP3155) TaxID=1169540 RepID=A0A0G4EL99_VITBC|nr:unnamed protein product [Vitrella brassicaformis CCMP3155]|eukprot:CEL97312.1 unnamed protein product [Vitrella brassicaformis CCMP3155]